MFFFNPVNLGWQRQTIILPPGKSMTHTFIEFLTSGKGRPFLYSRKVPKLFNLSTGALLENENCKVYNIAIDFKTNVFLHVAIEAAVIFSLHSLSICSFF